MSEFRGFGFTVSEDQQTRLENKFREARGRTTLVLVAETSPPHIRMFGFRIEVILEEDWVEYVRT